jgi:hypothetical protein
MASRGKKGGGKLLGNSHSNSNISINPLIGGGGHITSESIEAARTGYSRLVCVHEFQSRFIEVARSLAAPPTQPQTLPSLSAPHFEEPDLRLLLFTSHYLFGHLISFPPITDKIVWFID